MALPELVKVEALRAFTLTTEYGQFHGDPNNHLETGRFPKVPAPLVDKMVGDGLVRLAEDVEQPHLAQLDHDGDGEPGGSIAAEPTEDLPALRARYKAVVGKNPFPGWGADELNRRIEAASAAGDDDEEDGPPS